MASPPYQPPSRTNTAPRLSRDELTASSTTRRSLVGGDARSSTGRMGSSNPGPSPSTISQGSRQHHQQQQQPSSPATDRRQKPLRSFKKGTVASMHPSPAIALHQTAKVYEAAAYMAAKRVDAVLIVDSEGQLAGILTDRDITFRVAAEGVDPKSTLVSAVMTHNPVSVGTTTLASEALNRMVAGHFRHLPVIDEPDDGSDAGGVVGVLDITKCLYDALEKLDRAYESSRRTIDAMMEAGSHAASQHGSGGSAVALSRYAEMLKHQLSGPDLGSLLAAQTVAPPVVSLNDSVFEATRRMKAGKETATLVFDSDEADAGEDGLGTLAGIFTSKDLVLRVIAAGLDPRTTPVSRVMTPHPDCVTPETPVLEALRKMHAGRYLHLPVIDSTGVVEGLVDVLKLTYTTLTQLASMEAETSGGPMWNKFWDNSIMGGTQSEIFSETSSDGNKQRAMSSLNGHNKSNHPHEIPLSGSPLPSQDDDHTVYPEDSASRVTTGDSPNHISSQTNGATSTTRSATNGVGGGAGGHSSTPGTTVDEPLPTMFTFKLKDLDTGKVHRISSTCTSLLQLTQSLVTKLGESHPRVAGLVRGQRLSLSYIDDEGDFVHLENDADLIEAVKMARNAGWARVMLSMDSQRVFPASLGRVINSVPGQVFLDPSNASMVSMSTSEGYGGGAALSEIGMMSPTVLSQDGRVHGMMLQQQQEKEKAKVAGGFNEGLIAPVLIGSGAALVCAFLLGRAFKM